jgi:hypothetical protein
LENALLLNTKTAPAIFSKKKTAPAILHTTQKGPAPNAVWGDEWRFSKVVKKSFVAS